MDQTHEARVRVKVERAANGMTCFVELPELLAVRDRARGAYLSACLRDRMSESYAARTAEARALPLSHARKNTGPSAPQTTKTPDVVDSPIQARAQLAAPGSAARAIENEQSERHAIEERARVAATSRREAERGEALIALSESERAQLDERARLSLPQHQRAPWDIRRRAVAMLHGEYCDPKIF